MSKEIGDDYASSLADLTMNSKPLINMLTILADENIKHAAVIVQSVETHLDQVGADIKLPVLYLVDSIIKNVGGVYTQLFSQSIVGMFCRVFKQVDEKTRSQMFKLRETWHDVFPSIKLYQLDVKVSLIDPAWPIQAQPPQSGNIHVNPNFFKNPSGSPTPSTSGAVVPHTANDEEMMNALALKEQELLLLQKKKVELELEQTKKLLEQSKYAEKKSTMAHGNSDVHTGSLPSAVVVPTRVKRPQVNSMNLNSTGSLRIAPVSSALVSRVQRRDPRLSRDIHHVSDSNSNQISSQSEVKIHNKSDKSARYVKSSDVNVDQQNKDDKLINRPHSNKKDPRLNRNKHSEQSARLPKSSHKRSRTPTKISSDHRSIEKREKLATSPETIKISRVKLPPIPKLKVKNVDESHKDVSSETGSPVKKNALRHTNVTRDKLKKSKSIGDGKMLTPEKNHKNFSPKKNKLKSLKYTQIEVDPLDPASPPPTDVTFKELKNSTKERNYIRRNREKSESPDKMEDSPRIVQSSIINDNKSIKPSAVDIIGNGVTKKDVDLRLNSKPGDGSSLPIAKKRQSSDKSEDLPSKKSKSEKFDALFGNEDVDLRELIRDKLPSPSPPLLKIDGNDSPLTINEKIEGNWAKVKEVQSPHVETPTKLHNIAESLEALKNKDALGRPYLFQHATGVQNKSHLNINPDIDMRQPTLNELDGEPLNTKIQTILSQAEENLRSGEMDKEQYNVLIRQVLQLNETQKLKEAQQKDSLEISRRKSNSIKKNHSKQIVESNHSNEESDGGISPIHDDNGDVKQSNFSSTHGDIDERIVLLSMNTMHGEGGKRPPLLPRPDMRSMNSDMRMPPNMSTYDNQDGKFMPRGPDMRFPGRHMGPRMFGSKGWRGMRPRMEERGGFRGMNSRGLLPAPNSRRMMNMGNRPQYDSSIQPSQYLPNNITVVEPRQMINPLCPYVNDGSFSPPPLGSTSADKGYPPIDPNIIDFIDYDTMKTIQIDGAAREIRYYDRTAIIMVNWDDPREISFAPGQRRIHFDDESFLLSLHDDYINVNIDGQPHRICLGGPTREVFIDESWFECFFGGPPIPIMLNNKVKYMKLDGPPPQVNIGKVKRLDLVAGKINLIVDGTTMLPVFLDAKPQKFDIEHVTHTLRFVDSLQTILINEKPHKVEFGGLPKPFFVKKKKHFIRFSVLPQGIKEGSVNIRNMEGKKPAILPTPELNSATTANMNHELMQSNDLHYQSSSMDNYGNSGSVSGGLDVLASVMPSSMAPASQFSGYSIAEPLTETKPTIIPGLDQNQDMSVPPPNISSLLQNINVNDLFAKLVASGIVSTLPSATAPKIEPAEETAPQNNTVKLAEKNFTKNQINIIKPVNLMKSETLKVRQPGLIASLHTGMQCGGCGARFPPEHTVRYSQHLDWHFRQNRADRHSQRRPNSRRWYYDISDWIQYQEIEDLEEREKNWFEREQETAEAAKSEEAAVVAARREQSSVPLKSGAPPEHLRCQLCHDSFDQFYNHDIDEWHLRNAVEYEANNYHPLCLDDYKLSLIKEQEQTPEEENKDSTLIDIDMEKENNDAEAVENEDEDSESNIIHSTEETNTDTVDQDNESIVEVLSEEANTQESTLDTAPDVEVVEEDDDVVIKNEPVEQIIVDDVDTDEETERERESRNFLPNGIPIDFANVKIKQEPIDPDDEPIITSESMITTQADTTSAAVMSSIDGNVQFEPTDLAGPVLPAGGIKINITKPIVSQPKEKEIVPPVVVQDSHDEPCPPGEEPEILYKLKPSLEGIAFTARPPCNRGVEMSGLCSIM